MKLVRKALGLSVMAAALAALPAMAQQSGMSGMSGMSGNMVDKAKAVATEAAKGAVEGAKDAMKK